MAFIATTIAIEYLAVTFLKLRPVEFALLQLTLLAVAGVAASIVARKMCAPLESLCRSFLARDNSQESATTDGVLNEIESLHLYQRIRTRY